MELKKPAIMVVGLRGFPNIQGGVETHAQNLYPEIAKTGYRITVLLRSPYAAKNHPREWNGVQLVKIWSPKMTSLEAVVHTLLGVLYAAIVRPDILHIQAIGPSILAPLARLLGLKTVVTHHGADYERQKWGHLAKAMLRLGECCGMNFANERIVISKTIHNHVTQKYGVPSTIIPNGVAPQTSSLATKHNDTFDLTPRRYILTVGRMVPEKRQLDLIEAFTNAKLEGWKLVIVGAPDHSNPYAQAVIDKAKVTPNVIATGALYGQELEKLYVNAGVFALPSSHEGLPIVLLEALSHGLPVILSDIDAHLEIELPSEHYYKMGDCVELTSRLKMMAEQQFTDKWRQDLRQWTKETYSWKNAAEKTIAVYNKLLEKKI